MVGCDMPGVRCGQGTHCTITTTTFKHNTIAPPPASCQYGSAVGSAVGVRRGGKALLQVCNSPTTSPPPAALLQM